jgi:hypothetical protein
VLADALSDALSLRDILSLSKVLALWDSLSVLCVVLSLLDSVGEATQKASV